VFGSSVSGRAVLDVTETLRAAVLDLYQRSLEDGEPPSVLHGHGYRGSGRNHVHWLALPDVGYRYSSGRIHGAAVWLPPNTEPDVIARLGEALSTLQQLVRPDRFDVPVRTYGGEARPTAARPDRWVGPSRRWVSAFPVVHERWSSRGPVGQEVQRWFAHAGFRCEVASYRTSTVPLLTGAPRLRPHEVRRRESDTHPYSFVEVQLDRQIEGPVVLGRARQFGLGLMLPRSG
jgi:CRISPR-associated protein Csb2